MTLTKSNTRLFIASVLFNVLLVCLFMVMYQGQPPMRTLQADAQALPPVPSRVWCGTPKQKRWGNINIGNAQAGQRHAFNAGWVGRDWEALLELGTCESNWNHVSRNSIGCHGIPQACPGKKMAAYGADWETNPDTQLKFMVAYIKQRYGTPTKAIEFHHQKGWY